MAKKDSGTYFDGITKFTHELHEMAVAIGPGWGLTFLVVMLLLLPHVGILPLFMKLVKEDRVDKRKQNVELERLKQRKLGRSSKAIEKVALPSRKKEG